MFDPQLAPGILQNVQKSDPNEQGMPRAPAAAAAAAAAAGEAALLQGGCNNSVGVGACYLAAPSRYLAASSQHLGPPPGDCCTDI